MAAITDFIANFLLNELHRTLKCPQSKLGPAILDMVLDVVHQHDSAPHSGSNVVILHKLAAMQVFFLDPAAFVRHLLAPDGESLFTVFEIAIPGYSVKGLGSQLQRWSTNNAEIAAAAKSAKESGGDYSHLELLKRFE